MQVERMYDVKRISRWFKTSSTRLPLWLCGLVPLEIPVRGLAVNRREVFRCAAIVGAHREIVVHLGQVNIADAGETVPLRFGTLREALALDFFADRAYLSTMATILRTAIMLGLKLPEAEYGRIDQTRFEPFSYTDLGRLVAKASTLQ